MTTGFTDRTRLITINGGPYGPVTGGRYLTRTWSGADSPVRTKTLNPQKFIKAVRVKIGYRVVFNGKRRKIIKYTYSEVVVVKSRLNKYTYGKRVLTLNPYTMSIVDDMDPVVTLRAPISAGSFSFPGNLRWWLGAISHTVSFSANDEIELVNRLRSKIQGTDFNAGVFLAEGAPAMRMIFESATTIARLLRFAKKGQFSQAVHTLSEFSSHVRKADAFKDAHLVSRMRQASKDTATNVLALHYGWQPLVKDLQTGAEFLAHLSQQDYNQRVSVTLTKIGTQNVSPAPSAYLYSSSSSVIRTKLIAYLSEVDVVGLSGLTDVASVLWEVTPYSFVADWVLPIGNFLSARSAARNLKGRFVTTTTTRSAGSGLGYASPPRNAEEARQRHDIGSLKGSSLSRVNMTRTVRESLDVPYPQVKSFAEAFTWKRAVNAVALLTLQDWNKPGFFIPAAGNSFR